MYCILHSPLAEHRILHRTVTVSNCQISRSLHYIITKHPITLYVVIEPQSAFIRIVLTCDFKNRR